MRNLRLLVHPWRQIGEQQIAMLMTAKALRQPVTIYGSGTCTRWSDGEDIHQVSWAR